MANYNLRGPQVEPAASYWTNGPCPLPRVIEISDLLAITDHDSASNEWFFPPYPSDEDTAQEIAELRDLDAVRDDPAQLISTEAGRERLPISPFLQLRPQPAGAVFNLNRPQPPVERLGQECQPRGEVVIQVGRELARWFEAETPGLGHRHALNCIIATSNLSPPQQARIWMALDVTIYGALLAAWHYKWRSDRSRVKYRPRPIEVDNTLTILYDVAVNPDDGVSDGSPRTPPLFPAFSPGTPRHPSYPSGHSTVGGAASEILSYFCPGCRGDFDLLADNGGMARLWAGIHYRSDHVQGVKLGRAVARLVIAQLEADGAPRPTILFPPGSPVPVHNNLPPTPGQLRQAAFDHANHCAHNVFDTAPSTPFAAAVAPDAAARAGAAEEAIQQARSPQQGAR